MPRASRYGLTVGLWPTVARGLLGLGWFCAKPVQVPRCPATHGTPFIVGTGPPDTGVGAPLYPLSVVSAPATGAATMAAAQQPTSSDPHRPRTTVILDPVPSPRRHPTRINTL